KEKRAAELIIANKELAFQNDEKEKRAAELIIANKELTFQNDEKEKRAAELIIANKELAFQNDEKEKRAAELIIANKELTFQNDEKEKRAAELIIANKELAFQNDEKEKRAEELLIANKELEAFAYIASHDMQEPLRKIQTFSNRILTEGQDLTVASRHYFERMQSAGARMQQLIQDLIAYSSINANKELSFEPTDLRLIVKEIKVELQENIEEKKAIIIADDICPMQVIPFQFRQLLYNLISNAIKFASIERTLEITIKSCIEKGDPLLNKKLSNQKDYYHLSVSDNGIGFDPQYRDRIFKVFQKLHVKQEYEGTGIGLAIVKKIVDNHNGIIMAKGALDEGANFNIFLPVDNS
ncbi:MAG: two-component sensor histidine kinase, partial [Chitinophagaceae bacterium]|nr:two-component sensor histidine kinase [Chitinophagaceae bacterium]